MTVIALVAPVVLGVLVWPTAARYGGLTQPPSAVRPRRDLSGSSSPAPTTSTWAWRSRRVRDGVRTDQVADTLLLLVLVLRSGVALEEALRRVADGSTGPVRSELQAVVAALRWGVSPARSWEYAGEHWHAAAVAFELSSATGASPTNLLSDAAARIRERLEEERARRAARAGVLLVVPLGLGFLPAFACTAVVPLVLALADGVLSVP